MQYNKFYGILYVDNKKGDKIMSIKEFIKQGYKIEVWQNVYAYSEVDLEREIVKNTEIDFDDAQDIQYTIYKNGEVIETFDGWEYDAMMQYIEDMEV